MRELINFKQELLFKNNIAEISSISLECDYDIKDNTVSGNFIIEGSYRSHEISLNKENFSYKIPFEYTFKETIEEGSALVNVKDFTYNIDSDVLLVDIEYEVLADKSDVQVFEEQRDFEEFLKEHEVEIEEPLLVEEDLRNDVPIEENAENSIKENQEMIDEEIPLIVGDPILEEDRTSEMREVTQNIINDIDSRENTYITYHIHICDESDSIDTISMKYKISIDTIREYNGIDIISPGMKIIIPCSDE